MKTWIVTGGGCGGVPTTRTVKAEGMDLQWGCLVFYGNNGITLAIGVGYWNDIVEQEESND